MCSTDYIVTDELCFCKQKKKKTIALIIFCYNFTRDKSIIFYDSSKTSDDRVIIEDFVCRNKLSYKFAVQTDSQKPGQGSAGGSADIIGSVY